MIINHNLNAMNSHRNLTMNTVAQGKSIEKLSSGLRINRAGDDAAGLAISEKMRGQIRGLDQASRNAQDTISLIQTAEGALNETHSILQRMRELAVQSSNDTNTSSDRNEIQKELNQLADEIDRIANTTEFNTQKLLNGDKVGLRDQIDGKITVQNNSNATIDVTMTAVATDVTATGTIIIRRVDTANGDANDFSISDPNGLGSLALSSGLSALTGGFSTDTATITGLLNMKAGESVTISFKQFEAAKTDSSKALVAQIGANTGQNMLIGINDMKASTLGVRNGTNAVDVSDATKATAAITAINNAIETVSAERSKLGAYQNRLEHTINNLNTASENLQASESRIRDVDMAKEMMNQTKNSILSQAAQAMLAQANQAPQGVLQLLR